MCWKLVIKIIALMLCTWHYINCIGSIKIIFRRTIPMSDFETGSSISPLTPCIKCTQQYDGIGDDSHILGGCLAESGSTYL